MKDGWKIRNDSLEKKRLKGNCSHAAWLNRGWETLLQGTGQELGSPVVTRGM